jgi:choice-of-anchor B domain-containing protein
MKKLLLAFSLLISTLAFGQESMNVTLLSNLDIDTIPNHSFGTFNDLWGYVDSDGREYAIMGSAAYIHFIDVTDPTNPVQIAAVPGGTTTVWRDFKTRGDRVYAVSDNSGEGLIIFDVSDLPNSVSITYQNSEFFGEAHNIFIDEENGRLYAVGSDVQPSGVIVLDIATDPDQPILLNSVNLFAGLLGGYIHDLYVRDNIAYCSHGNTDAFIIWDFTDATDPQYIAAFESQGYNHSNWVSEDGNTVVFAEEVPTGLPMGILDISDKENDNLNFYGYFKFPLLAPLHQNATPHNPYIMGDYVYTSYYEDGIQIWDISDPANPTVAGYYDTYPDNTSYNGYRGCWGVYPFLPSGNIIGSDMKYGLFVLKADLSATTSTESLAAVDRFDVFPNPIYNEVNIDLAVEGSQEVTIELYTLTGKLLQSKIQWVSGAERLSMNTSELPSGMYVLEARFGEGTISEKIIKH